MMYVLVVVVCLLGCCVFFFKQKTAYEMRISDWSSDVCSSDLLMLEDEPNDLHWNDLGPWQGQWGPKAIHAPEAWDVTPGSADVVQIGRASCRERVCQYV